MHPSTAQLVSMLVLQFDAMIHKAEEQLAALKKENEILLARLAAREAADHGRTEES